MSQGQKKRMGSPLSRPHAEFGPPRRTPRKVPENWRPWSAQGLTASRRWIGIREPTRELRKPEVTKLGGWRNLDEFKIAYESHAGSAGAMDDIGEFFGCEEAMEAIARWRAATPTLLADPQQEGRDKLYGRADAVIATAHGWMPVAGSFATGQWADENLAKIAVEGHPIQKTERMMLPLFMRSRAQRLTAQDQDDLNAVLEKYAGAGHISRWDWEVGGCPAIVSSLDVLSQAGGKRIIMDARYANGGIEKVSLDLPSVKYICSRIKEGDLLAKFDLKTGYHQLRLHERDRGAMCFEWNGAIWNFNVVTLGTRDAPGTFQTMTRYIGDHLARRFGLRVEVYLDDFICIVPKGTEPPAIAAVMEEIALFGAVMGTDKCSKEWSTEIEALGFVVDSAAGTISVTQKKRTEAFELLDELRKATTMDAKQMATTIGKLQHLQDAVRHLFALMRPVVNNLIIHEDGRVVPSQLTKPRIVGCGRYQPRGIVEIHMGTSDAAARIMNRWDSLTPRKFREKREVLTIATDASDHGVGAVIVPCAPLPTAVRALGGVIFLADSLPKQLIGSSSMQRETYALFRAVVALTEQQPSQIRGKAIHVLTDNSSLYARAFKGSCDEATTGWLVQCALLAEAAGAELAAITWIPRALNTEADQASRQVLGWGAELTVDTRWFATWCNGIVRERLPSPNVDAFASPLRRQMLRYVSVTRATSPPWPIAIDAFATDWEQSDILWAFPPAPLARKAWQSWKSSESRAMYLCLLEPRGRDEMAKLVKEKRKWVPEISGREGGFIVVLFERSC